MKVLAYTATCLMAASGAGALMLGALKASRITVGAFDFNYGLQVNVLRGKGSLDIYRQ
jgi:hypothetical protein